jgi:hypothetical protein
MMKKHSETGRRQSGATAQQHPGRTGLRRLRLSKRGLGATVGLMVPVLGLGLAACGGTASSQAATTPAAPASHAAGPGGFGSGSGSNARSTNAAGGSVGKVSSVSSSSFTLSTPTGGKVTVKKTSSTVYKKGTAKSTANAVSKGKTVLVLGKVNSTTITASQVIVQPAINLSKASAKVVSFKGGTQGKSTSVGQVPSDYKQGSGTLVSGTKATKAIEASLSSYAGGVVDRVVQLSNGDYEVHNIGVNWPHHVFVNKSFKVIGAND